MRPALLLPLSLCLAGPGHAQPPPIELHHVLALSSAEDKAVALTLDACGGGYDEALVRFLIAQRIPVTVFATRRWIDRHPQAVAVLNEHPELFDIEDHGDRHVAAVIGAGRTVQGVRGSPDLEHLRREVIGGARAIASATGRAPLWYRGATAEYDPHAMRAIGELGYRIAGFSLNADEGATLHKATIVRRLARTRPGDIIIAHMNRPESDTAEALAVALPQLRARGFRFITLRDATVEPLQDDGATARSRGCSRSPPAGKLQADACGP
jgi:peptidoglycan/xylan/chitin deacetylase (PgdA/CDA1 family)